MFQQSVDHSHSPGFRGAETLRDGLARSLGMEGHDGLVAQIHRWQHAMSGAYKLRNLPPDEIQSSEAVYKWYTQELQHHSYHSPTWIVRPENAELFRAFLEDPYYHLKNLVEVVMRQLLEEMLRSQGVDATVYLTSNGDDVFGWTDVIIEARTQNGTEYMGIDIAVSDNPEYLEGKQQRTETICYEFNACKRLGKMPMVREVFSVPPHTMARFLSGYMERVILNGRVKPREVLPLFDEAKTRTTATVRETTRAKVCDTIH